MFEHSLSIVLIRMAAVLQYLACLLLDLLIFLLSVVLSEGFLDYSCKGIKFSVPHFFQQEKL